MLPGSPPPPRIATVLTVLAMALASGVITFLAFQQPTGVTATDAPAAAVPPRPGLTERLLERHGCWSDEAPADMRGRIPGHVVVTLEGAARPRYAGARMVGRALEQLPASLGGPGLDRGLTVHGFCR